MSVKLEGFPCKATCYNSDHNSNSSLEEYVEEKHNATVLEDNYFNGNQIVGSIEKIENKSPSHNEMQYYNFNIQEPPLNIEADDSKLNINNLEDEISSEVLNYVDDNKGKLLAELNFTTNENKSLDFKRNDSSEESLEKNKNVKKENVFGLQSVLNRKKFYAEWKSKLECDICCELIPTFQELKTHYRERHNTKGYVRCCGRKFEHLYLLVDHFNLHTDPEKYKCDLCNKLFTTKSSLYEHKKIIHGKIPRIKKKYECKTFECIICSKIFKRNDYLNNHMLKHEKNLKCDICGITFNRESGLKNHIKRKHSKICDKCGKTFGGIKALRSHLKEEHKIFEPLKCEECGSVMSSMSILQHHKAIYHKPVSTVFICNICGKASVTAFGLRRHKKYVHKTERKYKCPDCDKAFRLPKLLLDHMTIHTGETKYKCTLCPRYYTHCSSYNRHLKNDHPTEWESHRKSPLHKRKIDSERVTSVVVM